MSIRTLFEQRSYIVSNTLAWAAIDLMKGLAKNAGKTTTLTNMQDYIKPDYVNQWYSLIKKNYNFAKHADHDAEDIIVFDKRQAEVAVFIAVEDYMIVFGQITQVMSILKSWFYMAYPGWIKDDHRPFALENFSYLNHSESRARALAMLNYLEEHRTEMGSLVPSQLRSVIEA